MRTIKVGIRNVKISNPDKVIFPNIGLTKFDVVQYYKKVGDYMLPHIKDRPITLHRYPNGIKKKNFYQKDSSEYFPDWIKRVKINKKEGESYFAPLCNKKADLVFFANLASIALHAWLSKIKSLHKPDKMIFDLDPSEGNFDLVKYGAKKIRQYFEHEIDTTPYLMTTGSSGIHIIIPIKAETEFDQVRRIAQETAKKIAKKYPDKLTVNVRKSKRKGRLYLDTARNAFGQTAVVPFALRALENAPIAVPIAWNELNKIDNAKVYNQKNIFRRLSQKDDPWMKINRSRISIRTLREL